MMSFEVDKFLYEKRELASRRSARERVHVIDSSRSDEQFWPAGWLSRVENVQWPLHRCMHTYIGETVQEVGRSEAVRARL